jgi:hypothetical protein
VSGCYFPITGCLNKFFAGQSILIVEEIVKYPATSWTPKMPLHNINESLRWAAGT